MSRSKTLAIVDGYSQVQFGRDAAPLGTDVPRMRLREMEVSKLHATVYYDEEKKQWAVVDMGSKHGTYIRPGQSAAPAPAPSTSTSADSRGQRLSGPRASSMPRRLKHLDELSLGTTTFVVHIHEDRRPCEACTSKGEDEIPLFDAPKVAQAKKRKRDPTEPLAQPLGDAKKSLQILKKTMLSRHSAPSTPAPGRSDDSKAYLDRSARRRALHPSMPDAPGVPIRTAVSTPSSRPVSPPPPEPVSAPSAPLTSSNIGHRLLMKQGWTPGTTLGQDNADPEGGTTALAEPIQVSVRPARTGLGVPDRAPAQSQSQSGSSWKEEGKRRRWTDLQSD